MAPQQPYAIPNDGSWAHNNLIDHTCPLAINPQIAEPTFSIACCQSAPTVWNPTNENPPVPSCCTAQRLHFMATNLELGPVPLGHPHTDAQSPWNLLRLGLGTTATSPPLLTSAVRSLHSPTVMSMPPPWVAGTALT